MLEHAASTPGEPARRRVVILGSTGSIGTQALEIIAAHPDRFTVTGLAAGGSDPRLLAAQAWDFDVDVVAVEGGDRAREVAAALAAQANLRGKAADEGPVLTAGPDAVVDLAGRSCDVVLNGIAGAAGLRPTLAALDAGSILALANKESLIIGGPVVTERVRPGQIIPVDSEHSALAQALLAGSSDEVRRLILTASGGPFRGCTRAQLAHVTVEQALAHPTWKMGPLVTINSATMVNKGLQVIEAHLLFDVPLERIDVVVHPQSVVHSMVEFIDGSTIAQASPPDMRIPISLGLDWPHRVCDAAPGCDWTHATTWEFFPLDSQAFPAVDLARRAAAAGGGAPAVFNAADEAAVEAFLSGELTFTGIVDTVAAVLEDYLSATTGGPLADAAETGEGNSWTLERVLESDAYGRRRATEIIEAGPGV